MDSSVTESDPVRIEERLIHRISVREWGLPTCQMDGKIWRSKDRSTISCMVTVAGEFCLETRQLVIVEAGKEQWIPPHWQDALWIYCQRWPSSGCSLGPFLRISHQDRCNFVRLLATKLAGSDDIGCLAQAQCVGELAAAEFERIGDEAPVLDPAHSG